MNDKKADEKYKLIINSDIYPLLCRLSIPSIIGIMVASLYALTDTFFIGKLDKSYLTAAIGLVFSFVSIIQAIGFWFGYGCGNYISRKIGARNRLAAQTMASTGIAICTIVGTVICIFSLLLLKPLAIVLGADSSNELLVATISYLKIIIFSIPFMIAANAIYNMLRLAGSPKEAMIGALVGVGINVALDPIFIFWLHMSVSGAALASLVGQVIGFLVLFYFTMQNENMKLSFNKIKLTGVNIKQILLGGLPNFSRHGISSLSLVIYNRVALSFGGSVVAALTISLRFMSVIYAFVIGFSQGFQPICAMNYGAKKYERIKKAFKYTLITVTIYLIIVSVVIFLKANIIMAIFSSEQDVVRVGAIILRAWSFVLPFMAYYILSGMFLQNIGQFTKATFVTTAENGTFFIPIVLILSSIFGFDGFVMAKPISSILALVFSIYVVTKAWNKYLNTTEGSVL